MYPGASQYTATEYPILSFWQCCFFPYARGGGRVCAWVKLVGRMPKQLLYNIFIFPFRNKRAMRNLTHLGTARDILCTGRSTELPLGQRRLSAAGVYRLTSCFDLPSHTQPLGHFKKHHET